MKKIIKAMVLALLLVGCLSSNAFAAVMVPIEPLWDNVPKEPGDRSA